jgi:hypothetical protein
MSMMGCVTSRFELHDHDSQAAIRISSFRCSVSRFFFSVSALTLPISHIATFQIKFTVFILISALCISSLSKYCKCT